MAGTFKKLKRITARLQGGAEAAVAVPYELKCECGVTVAGMRRKTWIESECPDCCQTLYVLPANVYPATKQVPSEVLGGSLADRLKTVVGELLPKKKKSAGKKPDKTPADKAAAKQKSDKSEVVVPPRPRFKWPRIDVLGFLKRTFTPFRLLMMAMTLVMGVTIYWMTQQRAIEEAQAAWLKSPDEIAALLDDSKMIELQQALESAVQAADVLQRDDPESRLVRNMLDETIAINTIASVELLTAFHDAYDNSNTQQPRTLQPDALDKVQAACGSGTFVFDSYLTTRPGQPDVYLAEFPTSPDEHPIEILIPLPDIGEFLESAPDGRAIFTIRIDQIAPPTRDTQDSWMLHVDPTAFVLLTSLPHCEQVGLTTEIDSTLEAILQRQRDFVESSSTWYDRAPKVPVDEDVETSSENDPSW